MVVEENNRNVVVEKKLRVWSVWGSCMVDVESMYGRCGRRWKLKIKSKIKKGMNSPIENKDVYRP